MPEWTIGFITARVDAEATRALYRAMPEENDSSAVWNFRRNLRQRRAAVEEYFLPLGVDPEKPTDLFVSETDPWKQRVFCACCYPVAAELDEGEKRFLRELEEDFTLEGARERTKFGGTVEFLLRDDRPVIYLDIELPWMLSPPLPFDRFVNRVRLPELPEVLRENAGLTDWRGTATG